MTSLLPQIPQDRDPRPRASISRIPVYSSALPSAVPILFRASSNEAPTAPSPAVIAAVLERAGRGNRYPVIHGADLIEALSESMNLPATRISVGDGSLSLLNYLLLAFVEPGHRVVYAWRSYEAYPICVLTAGGEPVEIPVAADFSHNLDAMAAAVDNQTDVVILCNPNNPTGTAFGRKALVAFLESVPRRVIVVLDEAYREFVDPTVVAPFDATELQEVYPNLVILRTFSKAYALAGFRVGYLIAGEPISAALASVLPPFPVAAAGVSAAIAALGEPEVTARLVETIHGERQAITAVLLAAGLPVVPSSTNFVWIPVGAASDALAQRLRESGISIRLFAGEGVRITVGEPGLPAALESALDGFTISHND